MNEKEINDNITDTNAHLERVASNASLEAKEMPRFDSLVRIMCTSHRNRLADPDGISYKAAIDGIVKAGILKDDSTKQIEEVRCKQVKTSGK